MIRRIDLSELRPGMEIVFRSKGDHYWGVFIDETFEAYVFHDLHVLHEVRHYNTWGPADKTAVYPSEMENIYTVTENEIWFFATYQGEIKGHILPYIKKVPQQVYTSDIGEYLSSIIIDKSVYKALLLSYVVSINNDQGYLEVITRKDSTLEIQKAKVDLHSVQQLIDRTRTNPIQVSIPEELVPWTMEDQPAPKEPDSVAEAMKRQSESGSAVEAAIEEEKLALALKLDSAPFIEAMEGVTESDPAAEEYVRKIESLSPKAITEITSRGISAEYGSVTIIKPNGSNEYIVMEKGCSILYIDGNVLWNQSHTDTVIGLLPYHIMCHLREIATRLYAIKNPGDDYQIQKIKDQIVEETIKLAKRDSEGILTAYTHTLHALGQQLIALQDFEKRCLSEIELFEHKLFLLNEHF